MDEAKADYIFEKWVAFLEWCLSTEGSQKQKAISNKTTTNKDSCVYCFKWRGNKPENQLTFLYRKLIEKRFISEDTNMQLFGEVFYWGKELIIHSHCNIKWIIKGKNKSSSKSTLFHFIDLLVKYDFLDKVVTDDTKLLYRQLEMIFANDKGIPLKNLKQSNSQRSKNPIGWDILDEVISSIPK